MICYNIYYLYTVEIHLKLYNRCELMNSFCIVLLTVRSVERDMFPPFVRSESYTFRVVQAWERDSRISIQSKTSAGMWRRRPISRKASRPAFLEAWSLRRLVIEIYSAKQSSSNVQHRRRETLVRETHSSRVRGDSSLGASNSIGACGADSPVRASSLSLLSSIIRPDHDTVTQARKERESEGGSFKGHPKRRKPSSKAKSYC